MKRRFRIITTLRTLYVVAKNTREVGALLAKNGLMKGERVVSTTAIANVGADAGIVGRAPTCPDCGKPQVRNINGKPDGAKGYCVGLHTCLIDPTRSAA